MGALIREAPLRGPVTDRRSAQAFPRRRFLVSPEAQQPILSITDPNMNSPSAKDKPASPDPEQQPPLVMTREMMLAAYERVHGCAPSPEQSEKLWKLCSELGTLPEKPTPKVRVRSYFLHPSFL